MTTDITTTIEPQTMPDGMHDTSTTNELSPFPASNQDILALHSKSTVPQQTDLATSTYSTTLYNTLPTLYAARTWFDESIALAVINHRLGPLIKRHNYHDLFGVCLLHRHFLLPPTTKLVEYGMTSSPWTDPDVCSDADDFNSEMAGGCVIPSSWTVVDEVLIPYEFTFVPYNEIDSVEDVNFKDCRFKAEFAREFIRIIRSVPGMEKILGLKRYMGPETWGAVEITQRYSNVLLRKEQVPPHILATAIEAAWFFDPAGGYRNMACSSYCRSHFKNDN